MNAFMHAVFPAQADVKLIKDGKRLRIEISSFVAGERIVVEVNSLGDLEMKGFSSGQHSSRDS